MKKDAALDVVEAAYAPRLDEAEWLDGILRALAGFELGETCGYCFEPARVRSPRIGTCIGFERADIDVYYAAPDPVLRYSHVPAPRVEHSFDREARIERALGFPRGDLARRVGRHAPELIGIIGSNADGTEGALLGIRTRSGPSARARRLLTQVGAHVETAYRLRKSLGLRGARRDPNAAAAVLDSEGTLLHATSEAQSHRASLAVAAKNADAARCRSTGVDPERALELWSALVSGRWSIVDHVESDGRRLLLAVENPPNANLLGLTDREAHVAAYAALGHSQKHIAYELGLEPSMVSKHLRNALRKWGLSNRAQLIRAFGPLARLTQALRATANGPEARAGPGPTPGE